MAFRSSIYFSSSYFSPSPHSLTDAERPDQASSDVIEPLAVSRVGDQSPPPFKQSTHTVLSHQADRLSVRPAALTQTQLRDKSWETNLSLQSFILAHAIQENQWFQCW